MIKSPMNPPLNKSILFIELSYYENEFEDILKKIET